MSYISQLEWRHATKGFDQNKKVTDEELNKVLHAIRMAPSSYGLQPFEVHVVKDQGTKDKLLPHAWNQRQIVTCAALLVFVTRTEVNARIDEYFKAITGGNADARAGMKAYEGMMRGSVQNLTEEDLKAWTARQVYIALGFGLAACAELKLDSCPMEGFVPAEFDKILGLPAKHYSTVLLTVGHRDPSVATFPKFRFPEKDLFKHK